MKLINEKGKLFGIINIVDLLALLLVLFVAFVVGWKLFGDSIAETAAKNRLEAERDQMLASRIKVTYTVRIPQLTEEYAEASKAFGFPQQLAINEGIIVGAYITDVRTEPTIAVNNNGGAFIGSGLVDLVFTVEALVPPDSFILVGNQEVRVGKAYVLKTQFTEMTGVIETMECDGEPFIEAGQNQLIYPGDIEKK